MCLKVNIAASFNPPPRGRVGFPRVVNADAQSFFSYRSSRPLQNQTFPSSFINHSELFSFLFFFLTQKQNKTRQGRSRKRKKKHPKLPLFAPETFSAKSKSTVRHKQTPAVWRRYWASGSQSFPHCGRPKHRHPASDLLYQATDDATKTNSNYRNVFLLFVFSFLTFVLNKNTTNKHDYCGHFSSHTYCTL